MTPGDDEYKYQGRRDADWWSVARKRVREMSANPDNVRELAALTYLPFIGWVVVYFLKKKNEFCQFHVAQSLKLQLAILLMYIAVEFLNTGPIISQILRIIRFEYVTNFIMYISVWAYGLVSVAAAYHAWKGEKWPVPFLDRLGKKEDKPE